MRFKLLSHWSAVVLELQRSPWGQNLKKKKKKKRITELYAPLSSIIRCNCGMLTIGAIFTYSWIELDSYFFLSCLFSLKKKKKKRLTLQFQENRFAHLVNVILSICSY